MPPKVHRYLASLLQEGLVVQEQSSQRYQLGPEAIQLGLAAIRLVEPVRAAEPELLQLCETLGLTSSLAVMGNMGPTIVRWEEPLLPVTVNVRIGSVMPILWSASGQVFLAYSIDDRVRQLAEAELERASPEQRAQLPRKDPIKRLGEIVRTQGCGIAVDTVLAGMAGVAAPIFDFSGRLAGVVATLGTTVSVGTTPESATAIALKTAALRISQTLGYQPATS